MTTHPETEEDDGRLPRQPFLGLGITAAWFLVYILVHEALTIAQSRHAVVGQQELLLESGARQALHDHTHDQLRTVYREGAIAFGQCVICHDVSDEVSQRFGPTLHSLFGKTIGGRNGYAYSPALRAMAAEDHIWSPQALWLFVNDPAGFANDSEPESGGDNRPLKRTRMPFPGLKPPGQASPDHTGSCAASDSESAECATARSIRALIHYLAWKDCGGSCETLELVRFDLDALRNWEKGGEHEGLCSVLEYDPKAPADLEHPALFLLPSDVVSCDQALP